jgi:hypothetical protein
MPQLRRSSATPAYADSEDSLTPPAYGRGAVSAFGNLAAERAIFLFETGNITCDQKRGLINPVIAGNPTGKCAELAVQFRHIGSRHLGNLRKAGHTERFKQRIQLRTDALQQFEIVGDNRFCSRFRLCCGFRLWCRFGFRCRCLGRGCRDGFLRRCLGLGRGFGFCLYRCFCSRLGGWLWRRRFSCDSFFGFCLGGSSFWSRRLFCRRFGRCSLGGRSL